MNLKECFHKKCVISYEIDNIMAEYPVWVFARYKGSVKTIYGAAQDMKLPGDSPKRILRKAPESILNTCVLGAIKINNVKIGGKRSKWDVYSILLDDNPEIYEEIEKLSAQKFADMGVSASDLTPREQEKEAGHET